MVNKQLSVAVPRPQRCTRRTTPFVPCRASRTRPTAAACIRSWSPVLTPSSDCSVRTTPIYTVITSGNGAVTGTDTATARPATTEAARPTTSVKLFVVGGGILTEDGISNVPTKTAVVVNSNAGLVPTVTSTGSMSTGRRQFNATVLADGSVLATGGLTSGAGQIDLNNAITLSRTLGPSDGRLDIARQCTSYPAVPRDRDSAPRWQGHDRRWRDLRRVCMSAGYLEKNVEYFTPPHLYKHDGSGQLAARPVISSAPTNIPIIGNFTVTSSQAASIKKVGLRRTK